MRIDAHQHFWKFDPVKHSWITPEMQVIQKDFTPTDLEVLLKQNHIDGCVTVQVDQSEDETVSLVHLAQQNEFIKGVVGWIDLRSPQIRDHLTLFSRHKKVKGFRHIVQAEPDGFLLQKDFVNGVGTLAEFGLTYDILVYPHQLKDTISFVKKFPYQKFVLDHLAKPFIKKGILEPWKSLITELSAIENVWCKLSGMVTEANWSEWKSENLHPYLDVVFNGFGTKRLLYGSDWPVCLLVAGYPRQLAIIEDYIHRLSPTEKQGIMGENAIQFYNL